MNAGTRKAVDGTVLLTGASGLLGTWLRRRAPVDQRTVCAVHRTPIPDADTVAVDLRDEADVRRVLAAVRPSVVIHTAYAKDRGSIVAATAHLAGACRAGGAALVHVSTDVVFAGDGRPSAEDDPPEPVLDYGRWKAEAEAAVRSALPGAAIVRLPLVVSLDPEDHVVARIRDAALAGDRTAWFDDEYRQPADAGELAGAIWDIVRLDAAERAGAWHLPGPESLTRHEIARRVVAALRLDPASVVAEPTPASQVRPRHIHLLDDRARHRIGWSPSPVLGGEPLG